MVVVRFATRDDVDAAVDLWNRAAGPSRSAGNAGGVQRLLRRDPQALLVAEHDGRIVGTLIVGYDGWRCHMYRMAVEPDARRAGVASALVARAQAVAAGYGVARLDAMVAVENAGAIAFWESAGFEPDPADGRWSLVL